MIEKLRQSPDTLTTWPTKWTALFRDVPKMCPKRKQVGAKICPDLLLLLWSCGESNPLLYQAKCLLSCQFVPSRSGSVRVVTWGFVLGS